MERVLWEQDAQGSTAVRELKVGGYISPPSARQLMTRLMHELTTISARFADHGSVSFLRVLGVSEFDKQGGCFYGLYTSGHESGPASSPNYCLRKVVWNAGFKSVESILEGVKAKSLFFNSFSIDGKWKKIVDNIDRAQGEELVRFERVLDSERNSRTDKKINFFGSGSVIALQGEYDCREMYNHYLEERVKELSSLFAELELSLVTFPDIDSLRITYDFDRCSFLFN